MQEDCLSSHLTVEEAMNQAAKLKLSKHMKSDEIQEKNYHQSFWKFE